MIMIWHGAAIGVMIEMQLAVSTPTTAALGSIPIFIQADTTSGNSTPNTEQTTAQKTKALKTGDESPVGYLLVLLALCGAAVVFTGKRGYLK
mgnify:CR=1 FL=1